MELELDADGALDINDDAEIPPESLFPRAMVTGFYTEVAKMKTCQMLNKVATKFVFVYVFVLSCLFN